MLLSLAALVCSCSCDKKDEEKPESVEPPPPGGASSDVVATNIGTGLGLAADLAPTSTIWEKVWSLGDKIAVVAGRAHEESIALRTTDGGRTWTALRTASDDYVSWNAALDGAVVMVGGPRKKGPIPPGKRAPIESARIWFAPADGALSEPSPFFPREGALAGTSIADGDAQPALLSGELAASIVDRGAAQLIAFAAPVGKPAGEPLTLPRARWLSAPYARPPQLLSIGGGGNVEVRPWPAPGGTVAPGKPIAGLRLAGEMLTQMDMGPQCEWGAWSFVRISAAPAQSQVVGVAPDRTVSFAAPAGQGKSFGCGRDAVVLEIEDEKKEPQLIFCTIDGKCAAPKSRAFEIWPEPHERRIHAVTTPKGVVATLSARAGTRWGVYLAQSLDGGATFELPRVIGEGKTERGRFEVGALVALPSRIVLILSAEEGATSRRRWYVLASDDNGSHWGPP
jgi:hypothetical protein